VPRVGKMRRRQEELVRVIGTELLRQAMATFLPR